MKVNEIFEMGLINDDTKVFIRDKDFNILAGGNWYQDNVLDYEGDEVESFTWREGNKVYIDVRQMEVGEKSESV